MITGRIKIIVITFLCLAINSGCTWFVMRPKNALRTVFHAPPRASHIGAPDFITTMNAVTHSTATENNSARLLTNGNEAFPAMLAAINSATTRVSMQTYIVHFDETGNSFLEALAAAARRGVKVRFLFDHVGGRLMSADDFQILLEAGVRVRIANPVTGWTITRFNNRNHRKILVCDGRTGFMGGLNLGNEYNGDGFTGWRDTAVLVAGPGALAGERVFARSWEQAGTDFLGRDLPILGTSTIKKALDEPFMRLLGRKHFTPEYLPEEPASTGTAKVWAVYGAPDLFSSPLLDMYTLAVNAAQRRIYISDSYFVPPLLFKRALVEAVRRGVDVRIMVPGPTDEPTTKKLTLGTYGKLLAEGVKIYEWQPTVMHAKTMVVDNLFATIGSANLDGRGVSLNYEANFAVLDPGLAAEMSRQFQTDLLHCKEITLEEWRQRPLAQKLSEYFLAPVQGQF